MNEKFRTMDRAEDGSYRVHCHFERRRSTPESKNPLKRKFFLKGFLHLGRNDEVERSLTTETGRIWYGQDADRKKTARNANNANVWTWLRPELDGHARQESREKNGGGGYFFKGFLHFGRNDEVGQS